jgi:exonuclease III
MNVQSLNNKAGEFIDFIYEYQPDIVALTEMWFRETAPSGYKLLDHPRSYHRGGWRVSCLGIMWV